jgi:hypothetical protein
MERELEQQVLGRRPGPELAPPRAPPLPESLAVEREEAGRRHHAPVQLHDPAAGRIAKRPRVVATRDLGEARLAERRDGIREALEHQHIDVGHRPVRLDPAHRFGHHRALHRQRPDPERAEALAGARGEGDLPERAHEERTPLVGEPRLERDSPRRPLALDRP